MKLPILLLAVGTLVGCSTPTQGPRPATVAKPALAPYRVTLPPAAAVHGPSNPLPTPATTPGVKYYSSIVGLNPEMEKRYRELHADVWPEVVAAIRKANIRNYNIYVTEIEGRRYLVSTLEYVGTDPARDFASIGQDPTTRDKWWPLTDACQFRLPGTAEGEQWRPMEQVMHLP